MTSNVENESFINKFKNVRLDALLVDTKSCFFKRRSCLPHCNDRMSVFVEEQRVDVAWKNCKIKSKKYHLKNLKKDWVSRGGYKLDAVTEKI